MSKRIGKVRTAAGLSQARRAVVLTKRIKSKPLTDAEEMLAVVQRLCDVCLVKISSEP